MVSWSNPPLPPRFQASRHIALVGRQRELETLDNVWDEADRGQRQVVFIGGEPGAGKTRLAAEIGGAARSKDAAVLVGSSSAVAGIPYQPFGEMLDHLFLSTSEQSLADHVGSSGAELARLSEAVSRHRPDTEDETSLEGEGRRRLFDSVAGFLRRLTTDRTVVLVLEDVHWAQPPTIALFEHVVQSCSDVPMLAIATFRTTPPDASDELSERMADLHRLEGVRRIDLVGLDTEAIAEYLSQLTALSPREARAPAAILRDRTGGNPFFLRELWGDMESRGGVSALRSPQRVPASIGDSLARRLSGMGGEVRQVIEMAAILGDSFHVSTLVQASEVGRLRTLAAIDQAIALRLIEPVEETESTYSFVHSLSRQAVIDLMTQSRRTILHGRAAETLEEQGPKSWTIPRLAHHYLAASVLGYGEEATRYATEAGALAEKALAFEEAAMWFERAAALPGSKPANTARSMSAAAINHVRSGRFQKGREIYDQLASSSDPLESLKGAIGYEDANWRPGLAGPHAADLLTSAIERCGLSEDDPTYIVAMGSLGRALAFAGETAKARRVGDRAIVAARKIEDDATLAHALTTSLWHGLTPDVAKVQLKRSRELSAMAVAHGDWETLGSASYFRTMVGYLTGHPQDVELGLEDNRKATRASGQPFFEYVTRCISGGRAFIRGDFDSATALAKESFELASRFGAEDADGPHGVQMFLIHREKGALENYRHLFTGDEAFHGRWVPGLLAVYTELHIEPGIRRALRHLLSRDHTSRTAEAQWPLELEFMAEAAVALGDEEAARKLIPLLNQYSGMNLIAGQFVAPLGSADRHRARLYALLGDDDTAETLFNSAVEIDRRMGSVVHHAETLAHHSRFLLERGDEARARELTAEARRLAEPIDQKRVLNLLEVSDRQATVSRAELTGRELDVLRLVAEGLSNKEIADRLYISINTAANHVRSILIKTGAANRTQAAIYAADHNLV